MPNPAGPDAGVAKQCPCRLCERSRGWSARYSGTKAQLRALLNEVRNELCSTEFELDCLQYLNPSGATAHNVKRRAAERAVIKQARKWAGPNHDWDENRLLDAVRALEAAMGGENV